MRKKIAVILGPTATGKSHCAIEVAKRVGGEIISGDSMLVYRGMNIGTAKPSPEELRSVPHHLVDILPPEASFSVAEFKPLAEEIINKILAKGHVPIIAGGTGLYLKALIEGYDFNRASVNIELRRQLEAKARAKGKAYLYGLLKNLAPNEAERIDPGNERRLIRAIESALQGEKISRSLESETKYDARVFGLTMERSLLYERINKRVDLMLAAGLEQEVRGLLAKGVSASCQAMQSIGYRQMLWYINGDLTWEDAVAKIKQATRNFAKRQVTWYKKMPYIYWFQLEREPDYEAVVKRICEMLV